MKAIIFYATKHGAAEEIAKRIAGQIENAVMFDLKQEDLPSINDYDLVIIGSSVYAGSFRKEAKEFLVKNADELGEKKLALFASGMSESESSEMFKINVPEKVLQNAVIASVLGGIFDPKKSNFFERLIMKIVTKQSGYYSNITDEKINEFVKTIYGND